MPVCFRKLLSQTIGDDRNGMTFLLPKPELGNEKGKGEVAQASGQCCTGWKPAPPKIGGHCPPYIY